MVCRRRVDGTSVICDGEAQAQSMLKLFNAIQPNATFTMEKETGDTLALLDVELGCVTRSIESAQKDERFHSVYQLPKFPANVVYRKTDSHTLC